MWSLETSLCRGEVHLGTIKLPSLVIQSTGDMGVFTSDARLVFDSLGATDKTLETPKGAHYFEDSEDNRERAIDLMAAWINERT